MAVAEAAVITNGVIKLGIYDTGNLTEGSVGLLYVPTGGDAITPGCPCEGWGAADLNTSKSGYANASSGTANLTVESFTSTSDSAISVVRVNVGSVDIMRVTHNYRPSASSNLYEGLVTIENLTSSSINLRYRRNMDWDVPPTTFNELTTVITGGSPYVTYSNDNGFTSSNPLTASSPILFTGEAVDSGPSDHGALFDFGLGTLSPGASINFFIYYGAAANHTEAMSALNTLGIGVFSLGKPSNTTDGSPNTFIFGFKPGYIISPSISNIEGTTATIEGDFTTGGTTTVTVDGITATVKSVSSKEIIVVVPPRSDLTGIMTTVDVVIDNNGNIITMANGFTYDGVAPTVNNVIIYHNKSAVLNSWEYSSKRVFVFIKFSEEVGLNSDVTFGYTSPYNEFTFTPLSDSYHTSGLTSDKKEWVGYYTVTGTMSGNLILRIPAFKDTVENAQAQDIQTIFNINTSYQSNFLTLDMDSVTEETGFNYQTIKGRKATDRTIEVSTTAGGAGGTSGTGTTDWTIKVTDFQMGGNEIHVKEVKGRDTIEEVFDIYYYPLITSRTDITPTGTVTNPNFAASGDINGDGKSDIVMSNSGSNNISVLINGSFTDATNSPITVGSNPNAIALYDLNNDGKLDIVIVNKDGNNVGVTLGNGDGTFGMVVNYSTGSSPNGIGIADFNGDNIADIVTANTTSNNISLFKGNGDGTFQTASNVSTGSTTNPVWVTVGDFNIDGKMDIATANQGANNIAILLGNGDGTFQSPAYYNAGAAPISITSADFDVDGKLDIATSNKNDNNISIFIGIGDGTFQTAVNYTAGTNPSYILAADIDGDGKQDILTANFDVKNIGFFINKGDGTFYDMTAYLTGGKPTSLSVSDFDNDGKIDIAVPLWDKNSVSILARKDRTFSKAITGGNNINAYRMFSTPFFPKDRDLIANLTELGGIDSSKWRIFGYDPMKKSYYEVKGSGGETIRSLGSGDWIISSSDMILSFEGTEVELERPYYIKICPGWNIIGNPFNKDIQVRWIVSMKLDGTQSHTLNNSTLTQQNIWKWDSSSNQYVSVSGSSTMVSGEAYWIKNFTNDFIILKFNSSSVTSFKAYSKSEEETMDAGLMNMDRNGLQSRQGPAPDHVQGSDTQQYSSSDTPPLPPGEIDNQQSSDNNSSTAKVVEKGGCFIATAAYGYYDEPHVKLLREFRDRYLLQHSIGKWFVGIYYKYSPNAAQFIVRHDWAKKGVRAALLPMIGISYLMITTSAIEKSLLFLLVMSISVIGLIFILKRR